MAKKKNKQAQPQKLSPEKYIRLKARSLPIVKCSITKNWEEFGMAEIVVARRHAGGNYTIGVYLVDVFCLGVKDSIYKFNIDELDYEEMMEFVFDRHEDISYEEVHNIIYGAISFAEDLGIEPDKSFNLTQYILEEDTDDIPLIEYEFGKEGEPFLIVDTRLEASKYIPLLEKATGGDFGLEIRDEDYDDDSDYYRLPYVGTPYSYQRPEYPQELNLTHPELNRLLAPDEDFLLSTEEIEEILALPRETLITDLQQIVLYMIGQETNSDSITHALFFLGELRAEEALDTVLEVMRQDDEFMEQVFEDSISDVMGLTLYYVGRNKLPELLAFMKEPGLFEDFKSMTFNAVNFVATEPGRREEVLDWYRTLMQYYEENADDIDVYSPCLGGLMILKMLDIHPVELLPEIESLFDACVVDDYICGDYEQVEEYIEHGPFSADEYKVIDIHERYQIHYSTWYL